jgi:hypothetical protein
VGPIDPHKVIPSRFGNGNEVPKKRMLDAKTEAQ